MTSSIKYQSLLTCVKDEDKGPSGCWPGGCGYCQFGKCLHSLWNCQVVYKILSVYRDTIINCLGLVQPKKGAVLQDVARVLDLIKFVVF